MGFGPILPVRRLLVRAITFHVCQMIFDLVMAALIICGGYKAMEWIGWL